MCGFIFAIGLACLASTPASISDIGGQTELSPVFMPPLAISIGMLPEPPELFPQQASERDPSSMFDVSLDQDALFWRFNVEEALAQWKLCNTAVVARFDPIIAEKIEEPSSAPRVPLPMAAPAARLNQQPSPAVDQPYDSAALVSPGRLENPTPHLPLATSIREGGSVLAPLAFVRFCKQYATQCEFERAGVTVTLDGDMWKLLEDVNLTVNRSIEPVPDVYESWDIGVKRGDCDDYAVEKRRQLIARGLPAAALSLTEVVARGEGHLVLSVRTDRGTFILDNLRQTVVGWSMTGYRFVKIQSLERPSYWVAINGAEAPPFQLARAAIARKDALRRAS